MVQLPCPRPQAFEAVMDEDSGTLGINRIFSGPRSFVAIEPCDGCTAHKLGLQSSAMKPVSGVGISRPDEPLRHLHPIQLVRVSVHSPENRGRLSSFTSISVPAVHNKSFVRRGNELLERFAIDCSYFQSRINGSNDLRQGNILDSITDICGVSVSDQANCFSFHH